VSSERVKFHDLAVFELHDAEAYYEHRNVSAAERFRAAVEAAIETISHRPELLSRLGRRHSYSRVQGFPYILICLMRGGKADQIVGVMHTHRRPGYWRNRR
jgi:plasmid stabilization system protein ParE